MRFDTSEELNRQEEYKESNKHVNGSEFIKRSVNFNYEFKGDLSDNDASIVHFNALGFNQGVLINDARSRSISGDDLTNI